MTIIIRRCSVLLCGGIITLGAAELTLPITADTSISVFETERELAAGTAPRLKLKGLENLILLMPDVAALKGQMVERAELRLKGTDDRLMVRKEIGRAHV